MRLHGMSRDAFDRFTAKVPSWYYEIVAPGFKYNLTDIAAAIGIHQLQPGRRRSSGAAQAIAAALHAPASADLPLLAARRSRPADDQHAWHLYVIRLERRRADRPRRADRAPVRRRHRLQRALHPAAPAALLARPLRPRRRAQFPHSQRAYERMLSLPIYTAHDRRRRRPRRRRAARRARLSAAALPIGEQAHVRRRRRRLRPGAAGAAVRRRGASGSGSIRRARCSSARSASAAAG